MYTGLKQFCACALAQDKPCALARLPFKTIKWNALAHDKAAPSRSRQKLHALPWRRAPQSSPSAKLQLRPCVEYKRVLARVLTTKLPLHPCPWLGCTLAQVLYSWGYVVLPSTRGGNTQHELVSRIRGITPHIVVSIAKEYGSL